MPELGDGTAEGDFILEDDTSAPSPRPLTTDDLDAVLARRASPRRRLMQMGVIVVPILVVAGLILHSTLPAAPPTSTYVAVPTWTPRPIPITLVSNVTFGTVTVNGKRLAGPPPQNITLRAGNNVITLSAPPFPTQTCVVHGPLAAASGLGSDSTCQISIEGDEGNVTAHIYIMLMLSGDSLPPDLRASARSLVARTLGAASPLTTTVPAGDYYATGMGNQGVPNAHLATAPLTATFTQTLFDPTDIASATAFYPFSYACASALCGGGYAPSQKLPPHIWLVSVQTSQQWYFTAPSGLIAGSLLLPGPQPYEVALAYSPDTGWQMDGALTTVVGPVEGTSPLCQIGVDLLVQATSSQGGFGIRETDPTGDGTRGCSLHLLNQGTPAGTFIWRFGVLLAADATAHALLPGVPVAPPQEIAAVGA